MNRLLNWASQLGIGAVVIIVIGMGAISTDKMLKNFQPISTIFTASVTVPDFYEGGDPLVFYDLDIYESFVGAFSVEVKALDTTTGSCRGGGDNIFYGKAELLDLSVTTLSWYVSPKDGCVERLEAGQYFLETHYTIRRDGYDNRSLSTISNVFNVMEVGGLDGR